MAARLLAGQLWALVFSSGKQEQQQAWPSSAGLAPHHTAGKLQAPSAWPGHLGAVVSLTLQRKKSRARQCGFKFAS